MPRCDHPCVDPLTGPTTVIVLTVTCPLTLYERTTDGYQGTCTGRQQVARHASPRQSLAPAWRTRWP